MADIYVFMIFRKIQSIKFYKSKNLTEKDKNNRKKCVISKILHLYLRRDYNVIRL